MIVGPEATSNPDTHNLTGSIQLHNVHMKARKDKHSLTHIPFAPCIIKRAFKYNSITQNITTTKTSTTYSKSHNTLNTYNKQMAH
jgi:hypothetical protein